MPGHTPIVVVHPVQAPGLVGLLSDVDGADIVTPSPEDVGAALEAGVDGLVTYTWDDSFLGRDLRWVQAVSAGVDQFPIDTLDDRGIVLTSARGAHSPAVADHALALLLALLRGVGPAVRRGVDHRWRPEMAYETQGLSVGIIGLGSIGEAIARRLQSLGMSVIGCKRDPDRHEGLVEQVVGADQLDTVLAHSDAAILTLPHTAETESMIGRPQLDLLGGWLVNVGRGAVVNEEALHDAIVAGTMRGAALDVTVTEPLPSESRLWDLPEVIITPHMAWASDLLAPRVAEIVTANIAALRGEGEWVNRVER